MSIRLFIVILLTVLSELKSASARKCPETPECHIDTAVCVKDGRCFAFRRHCYWIINTTMDNSNVTLRKISDDWTNLPSSVDTAFTISERTYFIKGRKWYEYVNQMFIKSGTTMKWEGFPSHVDLVVAKTQERLIQTISYIPRFGSVRYFYFGNSNESYEQRPVNYLPDYALKPIRRGKKLLKAAVNVRDDVYYLFFNIKGRTEDYCIIDSQTTNCDLKNVESLLSCKFPSQKENSEINGNMSMEMIDDHHQSNLNDGQIQIEISEWKQKISESETRECTQLCYVFGKFDGISIAISLICFIVVMVLFTFLLCELSYLFRGENIISNQNVYRPKIPVPVKHN